MRAKKRVLLYCADAVAGEQMKFLLEVRNALLRVTAVASAEALMQAASATGAEFYCVVVYRSELGSRPLTGQRAGAGAGLDAYVFGLLGAANTGSALVEIANGLPSMGYAGVNRMVPGKMPVAMADAVEAIRMACARKRGPTKEKRVFSLAAERMVA